MCVFVSNYQSQNLPALLQWTSCTVHTALSLLATFNPSFCTVSLWKSMCLNSAAKTPNSAKKHMTRIHSHMAAAERNPVLWRTNTERTELRTTHNSFHNSFHSLRNFIIELKDTADDHTSTLAAEDNPHWNQPLIVPWWWAEIRNKRLDPEVRQTQKEGHECPEQMNLLNYGLLNRHTNHIKKQNQWWKLQIYNTFQFQKHNSCIIQHKFSMCVKYGCKTYGMLKQYQLINSYFLCYPFWPNVYWSWKMTDAIWRLHILLLSLMAINCTMHWPV